MERIRVATVAMDLLESMVARVVEKQSKQFMTEFMKGHNALLLEYHSIFSGRINLPNHSELESEGDILKSSNTWLVANYVRYNKGEKALRNEMEMIDMECLSIGDKIKDILWDKLDYLRKIIGRYAHLNINEDKMILTIEYNGDLINCSKVKYLPIAEWV